MLPISRSQLWWMKIESLGPGVILTMGKEGVGKTTIAATIALALAYRGQAVHLTTTEPAAQLILRASGHKPNLFSTKLVKLFSKKICAHLGVTTPNVKNHTLAIGGSSCNW